MVMLPSCFFVFFFLGVRGAPEWHRIADRGTVARTTKEPVEGKEWMTTGGAAVGSKVFSAFEAGYDSSNRFALTKLGCRPPDRGYMGGGFDVVTARQMLEYQCDIELPREEIESDGSTTRVSMLDECGGHYTLYHYHRSLSCLYDEAALGHSIQVAVGADNNATRIYGVWEGTGVLPTLDACGAHFGQTPEAAWEYHHHLQEHPPFVVGCYGPSDEGNEVTLEECRSYYPDRCGDGTVDVTTAEGTREYDTWCPCFSQDGGNVPTTQPTRTPTEGEEEELLFTDDDPPPGPFEEEDSASQNRRPTSLLLLLPFLAAFPRR